MKANITLAADKDVIVQLKMISQIRLVLGKANIKFWLRGGWAIDFLLGGLTRPHSDIDLVAWRHDASQLREQLVAHGFAFVRKTAVQHDFTKQNQEISVVFVTQKGNEVYVDEIPEWIWFPDALSYPPQQLNGLSCHVLSPKQLLEEKVGYQNGTGRPLRPKDRESIAILRERLLS